MTHSADSRERASGHLGRAAGAGVGCARNPGWRGRSTSARRGALGRPREGAAGRGWASPPDTPRGRTREWGAAERAPPRDSTAIQGGAALALPAATAASRGGGASGGSALGRRLTQSGRVSRDTEATPNRKRTKKITVRDAESKRTRSHHEQQRQGRGAAGAVGEAGWSGASRLGGPRARGGPGRASP